jgi:hypothetical protein
MIGFMARPFRVPTINEHDNQSLKRKGVSEKVNHFFVWLYIPNFEMQMGEKKRCTHHLSAQR